MNIKKHDLSEMNKLLANGKTIAEIATMFPKYQYWNIYWQVNDYSILGKKRSITNRLMKLAQTKDHDQRVEIAAEAQALLDDLYAQLKSNSAKLVEIDRILRE